MFGGGANTGIYLNPGNQNFVEFVQTGKYVDKTMLLDVTSGHLADPALCIFELPSILKTAE